LAGFRLLCEELDRRKVAGLPLTPEEKEILASVHWEGYMLCLYYRDV
jgi:hypothetical protein